MLNGYFNEAPAIYTVIVGALELPDGSGEGNNSPMMEPSSTDPQSTRSATLGSLMVHYKVLTPILSDLFSLQHTQMIGIPASLEHSIDLVRVYVLYESRNDGTQHCPNWNSREGDTYCNSRHGLRVPPRSYV